MERREHILKTDRIKFKSLFDGTMNYTVRTNDRNFGKGDVLIFKETEYTGIEMRENGCPLMYTGRELICTITEFFVDWDKVKLVVEVLKKIDGVE